MRYVHLPFGYDGIPAGRVAELARAAATVEGPIFVHCHHGKHRGPAAVGVICLANGSMTVPQAEALLRSAGTSPDYPGLFGAVTHFVAPTAAERRRPHELPVVFHVLAGRSDGVHDAPSIISRLPRKPAGAPPSIRHFSRA
jgi:hypothetical protein